MVFSGGLLEPNGASGLERSLRVAGGAGRKPDIQAVGPSQVLQRVAEFLPVMAEAEEKLQTLLQTQEQSVVNLENVSPGTDHIEMELECGVVDLLNDAAVRAAEQAMTNNVDVPECPESSNSIEEPVTPKQFGDGFDDHHSREAKVQSRKKQKLIHELD